MSLSGTVSEIFNVEEWRARKICQINAIGNVTIR